MADAAETKMLPVLSPVRSCNWHGWGEGIKRRHWTSQTNKLRLKDLLRKVTTTFIKMSLALSAFIVLLTAADAGNKLEEEKDSVQAQAVQSTRRICRHNTAMMVSSSSRSTAAASSQLQPFAHPTPRPPRPAAAVRCCTRPIC